MKKEAFLDYKNVDFSSPKKSHFSKGLTHDLVNLRLEIMFNGVLNKKEAFLDY